MSAPSQSRVIGVTLAAILLFAGLAPRLLLPDRTLLRAVADGTACGAIAVAVLVIIALDGLPRMRDVVCPPFICLLLILVVGLSAVAGYDSQHLSSHFVSILIAAAYMTVALVCYLSRIVWLFCQHFG